MKRKTFQLKKKLPSEQSQPIENRKESDNIGNSAIGDKKEKIKFILHKTSEYINGRELILGVSLRGKAHIVEGSECQDCHNYKSLEDGWGIVIVSDGAGSAINAERGSKAVCEIGLKLTSELVQKYKIAKKLPSEKDWYIEIRSVFEILKDVFVKTSEQENIDYKTFNATALILVYSPHGMLTAHIGDGRMGYKDKSDNWHALITPHKGEEANQTVFITSDWNLLSNNKMSDAYIPETSVVEDVPKAFVVMSDGCEMATWECVILNETTNKYEEVNKPFENFLNPMTELILEKMDLDDRIETFIEIIDKGNSVCEKETDDKTMVFGVLSLD